MSDIAVSENPPAAKQETPTASHRVYYVKGDEWEAANFPGMAPVEYVLLGYAWPRKDGDGFEVVLESLPVGEFNGRLTIRPIKRKT